MFRERRLAAAMPSDQAGLVANQSAIAGMRNAVRQIGPFPLVLIAFAAGVLAGRR